MRFLKTWWDLKIISLSKLGSYGNLWIFFYDRGFLLDFLILYFTVNSVYRVIYNKCFENKGIVMGLKLNIFTMGSRYYSGLKSRNMTGVPLCSFMLLIFLISSASLSATSKKLPSYLKSIVFFESADKFEDDSHTEKKTIAIGFVTDFRGKSVVMSKLDTFIYDYPPVLKTIDGDVIPVKSVSIPDDKRNLIIFEISPEFQMDKVKIIPVESDVSGNIDIDEKVAIYSRVKDSKTIKRQYGKITGMGTASVDVYASTRYDIEGGPVIYYDSGKCIGCISGRKEDSSKEYTAVRFDTIKKLVTIKGDWVAEDIAAMKEKKEALEKIKVVIERYKKFYESMEEKIANGHGTTNIKLVDSQRKIAVTAISQYLAIIRKPVDFHFPVYQKSVTALVEEAKVVLEDLRSYSTEKMQEAKAKQREKKFEGGPIEKPKL